MYVMAIRKGEKSMQPYRLALCEDDPQESAHLEALCGQLLSRRGISYTLARFASADELREVLERDLSAFDLLLLDIQMEGMNGMELAHLLHDQKAPVRFLFITGCPDYALEGHQVHPVHYLLKPVDPQALDEALAQDWETHCGSRPILFRQKGKSVFLPAEDIRYMESTNRSIIVHTPEEDLAFPLSLTDAERLTPPGLFARCHNSYLVNLDQVREVDRMALRLRDGTRLPVGRRYYQNFQAALIRRINR